MKGLLDDTRAELISQLSTTARGPRRNGVFAVLLLVHSCSILLDPAPLQTRSYRKRLTSLKKRLSSLSLPPSLRRSIKGAIEELNSVSTRSVPMVLQLLTAPARESISPSCASTIAAAARLTREALSRAAAPTN